MSDPSEAPGWWLASDGNWYPPESWNPAPAKPALPGLAVGATPPLQLRPGRRKLRHRWWPWATLGLIVFVAFTGILGASARPRATEYSTQGTPGTPGTQRPPNEYPLGTTAEIVRNGKPFYSVTATRFTNPAHAWLDATPQNAGDIFVAVQFTIRASGSLKVNEDILLVTRIYDSSGQSYFGSLEDTASGPHFKDGVIDVAPGASESGSAMFEVPGNVQVTKITFTPNGGHAKRAAVSWSLPFWPPVGCTIAHACSQ